MRRREADYNTQPRVNAIRMHNAATYGAGRLALGELEMFQAGCMAYQHYSATTAVAVTPCSPRRGTASPRRATPWPTG